MKTTIVIIILSILLVGVSIFAIKGCNDKKDLQFKITTQDSLFKLDSIRYSQLAKEYTSLEEANLDLKTKNEDLYNIIDENDEEIRYYTNLVLKVKNQITTRVDTVKFTVIDSILQVPLGQDTIGFNTENGIFKVEGVTHLFPTKGYWLNMQGKPFELDIVVTKDENGIFKGYVDTKNEDLEVSKLNVKVLQEPKKFWDDVQILAGANFTNKNTFLNLGFMKSKLGINLIGGFDYQNYTIDKDNLFYGGGLIYKLK
jgi:hypothetical protein